MSPPTIASAARPPLPNREKKKLERTRIPNASQTSARLYMWTAIPTKLGSSGMVGDDCLNKLRVSRNPGRSSYAAVMPPRSYHFSSPVGTADVIAANPLSNLRCGEGAAEDEGATSRRTQNISAARTARFPSTGVSSPPVGVPDAAHVPDAPKPCSRPISRKRQTAIASTTCAVATGGSSSHLGRIANVTRGAALLIGAIPHPAGSTDSAADYPQGTRSAPKRRRESLTSEALAQRFYERSSCPAKQEERKACNGRPSGETVSEGKRKRRRDMSDEGARKKVRRSMASAFEQGRRFDRMEVW